jgi:hypothetical protein
MVEMKAMTGVARVDQRRSVRLSSEVSSFQERMNPLKCAADTIQRLGIRRCIFIDEGDKLLKDFFRMDESDQGPRKHQSLYTSAVAERDSHSRLIANLRANGPVGEIHRRLRTYQGERF